MFFTAESDFVSQGLLYKDDIMSNLNKYEPWSHFN